jgi:hypothetical protein
MKLSKFGRPIVLLALLFALLDSSPLRAQQAAGAALASFPLDTQQLAYSNFALLRSAADFPQFRQRVLSSQFRGVQQFLLSVGVDPEKDVDEVVLGWRGEILSGAGGYGLASGRFEPERARQFFLQNRLPVRSYAGSELFAFGSGADREETYFTFLDSSLAAFGRLADLKAILDVRENSAPALENSQAFRDYETELDGAAPQWGILTGKAAATLAASWLQAGKKSAGDMTAFLHPVQAVLYRVEWDGGFSAHISVVCDSAANAAGLFKLLGILKSVPAAMAATGAGGQPSLLQNLDAQLEGARLELRASGPAEALDQILRAGQ